MRVVLQRVSHASCTVDGIVTGKVENGYLALVGFCQDDTFEIVDKMIQKIIKLRVFSDEQGKMNLSLKDISGSVLSISQFTLYANAKKGNRPSFTDAAGHDIAIPLYEYFNKQLEKEIHVETGVFGADMKIELLNDGPVTIVLDSKELFG